MTFYRFIRWGHRSLVAIAMLLLSNLALAMPPAVNSAALSGRLDLAPFLQMLPVQNGAETPEQAWRNFQQGNFRPFEPFIQKSKMPHGVWLAFAIEPAKSRTQQRLVLQVGPGHLDRVTAYLAESSGRLQQLGQVGDQVPRAQIQVPYHTPSFAVVTPRTHEQVVLLRIENQGSHPLFLQVFPSQDFPDVATRHGVLLGAMLTLAFLILGSALWLYHLQRQRLHLVWVCYATLLCVALLVNNGLLYYYVPAIPVAWINPISHSLGVLALAAGAVFLAELFQLAHLHRHLFRLLVAWVITLVILALLIPWWGDDKPLQLALLLSLPALIGATWGILRLMVSRHALALGIGLPLLLYLCTTFLHVVSLLGLGLFSVPFHGAWSILGFALLLVLLITMCVQALAHQRATQARRSALMQALTDKNLALEDQVRARTRHLEQALRTVQQTEASQRQLLSMASHEFRTPAAMIKMSLDSLRFFQENIPPEVSTRLDNIRLASQRLTTLANSLIVDDRLREPSLQLRVDEVDLVQLVQEVAAGYPASAAIETQIAEVALPFKGDGALLSIALHNLVDNALNHGANKDGSVLIKLQAHPDHVLLTVSDQGPGISDADKTRVFERFQHQESSRGSGLGLSIVRTIISAHGGTVHAEDNTPQGTRMVITLPPSAHSARVS